MTQDQVFSVNDREYMARAIQLARRGQFTADPNPCVGCVIVLDHDVVGEGWHRVAGEAHAEIEALGEAGDRASGATAYVTLEPCCHTGRTGACTEVLLAAGVAKVVFAVEDPNPKVSGQGAEWLQSQGVEVAGGLLADEATEINRGFWSRMQRQRPFVVSKIAASLDGFTALANGESKWISGEPARADVQCLRASSSAVLTGVGTVVADDPSLNVRRDDLGEVKQPLRVVLDTALKMSPAAKMLTLPGETLVVTVSSDKQKAAALEEAGAKVVQVEACDNGFVKLEAVLSLLAELEINTVLVEAGAELNGSFLEKGLLDELVVYKTPHIFGAGGRPMFSMDELTDMSQRKSMQLKDVRKVGDDLRLTYA